MEKEIMSPERLCQSLSITDLSDPKNGNHAISLIVLKIKKALETHYSTSKLEEYRINPIVSIKENFDDLLFPKDNAGRSSRYTRYISSDTILRTHTTAAVSGWLQKEVLKGINDSIGLFPGICYRRDVVDKIHSAELHQMDVWRIKKGPKQLIREDFIELVEKILNSVVPGYQYRINEVKHPYTVSGLEVEIFVNDSWLEILEGGEVHPTLLRNIGLSPDDYSGLALGMGLDRLVMVIKKIDDIRILRSSDKRIESQLKNLNEFIKVSNQPVTKRVISYSTSIEKNEEDICEEIRDALGENSVYIESIGYDEILYQDLPEKARQNLGINHKQKNVIATIVFRPIEKSLPKEIVNEWINKLYPILNKGSKGYI